MIRHAIAGIALMVAANGQASRNEGDFAAGMLERLRAAMPDVEMRISADDPLVIELKYEDDWSDGELDLHRMHAFCSEITAEECDAFLANFVSIATALPPAIVAENLQIVVRGESYLGELRERFPRDERPLSRRIGDDLFALLAFANDNGLVIATPGQVRSLGLGPDAAWRLASEQTRARLPDLPYDIDLAEHVVGFEEYDFLPSLLTDTQGWRGIAQKAGPDLFVTATSDVSVWVGVMPDGPRLEEFKQVVRAECADQEDCISPNVYRFRDGRWVIAD